MLQLRCQASDENDPLAPVLLESHQHVVLTLLCGENQGVFAVGFEFVRLTSHEQPADQSELGVDHVQPQQAADVWLNLRLNGQVVVTSNESDDLKRVMNEVGQVRFSPGLLFPWVTLSDFCEAGGKFFDR